MASRNVTWQRFSVSKNGTGEAGIFAVAGDGTIHWNDGTFSNGTARFGAHSDGISYAVFTEAWPNDMALAKLTAVDGMLVMTLRTKEGHNLD